MRQGAVCEKQQLDGARSSSFLWSRFSSERTKKTHGQKLFRDVILNNSTSHTVLGPCSHLELVEQIATQSKRPIPIASLSNALSRSGILRGRTIMGFPGSYFDNIARNHEGMRWWVSEHGLNMEVIASADRNISKFDELAGRLMFEARPRRLSNRRLPPTEYGRVGSDLDRRGFKPLDFLKGESRKKLADWNQKNQKRAIHTFEAILESNFRQVSLPRRGVQKRLHRAESLWIKLNNLSPQ
jgi:hypothetical protein